MLRDGSFTLVGVIHLLPLPGSAAPSPGLKSVRDRAMRDAETLVAGGLTTVIVENFGDAPFTSGTVDPHVPAMMAALGAELAGTFGDALELGYNVLRNDARAALAVAAAGSGRFVRINVHTGAAWTDQGLITGQAHDTLRYRRALGLEPAGPRPVRLVADVLVKHAVPAGETDIARVARDTAGRGRADVLVVTGRATGAAADLEDVRRVADAVPDRPVWVGSGVDPSTLAAVRSTADGAIVGTWLHRDGRLDAPLDLDRVRALVDATT